MKKNNLKKAYTLLFAALTAAVVLGVAVFISSVGRKQFILSTTARDSLLAIYNADSGIECAITNWGNITSAGGSFFCNNQIVNITGFDTAFPPVGSGWSSAIGSIPAKVYFKTPSPDFPNDRSKDVSRGCAVITFFIEGINESETKIVSRGYNLGDENNCPIIGTRTVERAISVLYK